MRPLERPVTVTPDVTAFLSPPDPVELIDENLPDEEPYVPYIPNLPPRPVRFPGRRKLTDDIERFQPTEFGTGVEPPAASASSEIPNFTPQSVISNVSPATQDPPRHGNRPDRSDSRRERGQRAGRTGDRSGSTRVGDLQMTAREILPAGPVDTQVEQAIPASEGDDKVQIINESDAVDSDESATNGADVEPRRRHRRRGRRRGRDPGPASGGGES